MLRESALIASDRRRLYSWTRAPATPPRGVIAHVHGMGEHSRRYDHLSSFWESRGYASAGFDQRGHGRSEGRRGHSPSYEQLMDDVASFLDHVEDHWGDLPVTLYGHSMGGNIVLSYALRRRPASLAIVASAPYLRFTFEPPWWKVRLGQVMGALAPTAAAGAGLEIAALSRDPAVIDAFRSDPLVHDRITAGFFAGLHRAAAMALDAAGETARPTLLMHGDADRITSPGGSADYVARSGGRAALKIWSGFYHELHNEPGWEDVAAHVVSWVETVWRGRAGEPSGRTSPWRSSAHTP